MMRVMVMVLLHHIIGVRRSPFTVLHDGRGPHSVTAVSVRGRLVVMVMMVQQ